MPFRLLITLSCLTLVLNTMAFITITPVLPVLFDEWMLTETETGLLGGATMALHASVGFTGGILGSLAIGATLQAAGGKDSADAWTAAFLVMAMGSAFGFLVRWWAGWKQPGLSS